MARIPADVKQSIDAVIEVTTTTITNPLHAARFFLKLDKVLNKDAQGRVNFATYARAWRRIYIAKAFNGENAEELAKNLGVSVDTVKNDLRWYWENQAAKKKGHRALNIPAMEAVEKSVK